ncbi:MAG: hypothetical protein AAGJ10_20585 [Bacteroidota bacterium]
MAGRFEMEWARQWRMRMQGWPFRAFEVAKSGAATLREIEHWPLRYLAEVYKDLLVTSDYAWSDPG